jgi:hypothetical protein
MSLTVSAQDSRVGHGCVSVQGHELGVCCPPGDARGPHETSMRGERVVGPEESQWERREAMTTG